ncbi:MAG: hypothetical protein IIA85_00960 [Nanoarchaeota archaeon]|nr:hypothetical protein [Nanoarchaeota archaeon]
MNLEKILVKGLLIASLASCSGGGSPETPEPIPPAKSLSQTAVLVKDIDIRYCATLNNVSSATRIISRNEIEIDRKTITASSCETLEGLTKGDYKFDLTASNVTPHSIEREVPNYAPELDLSSIDPSALNFYEDTEVRIGFPAPTDKNPEDNPVLITASSPDGKTNPRILTGNELVITNNQGETGDYTIEINYGSVQGGEGNANLNGNIANLTDIIGQLQDNETDLGKPGFVKVYSLEKVLLKEVETDVSGNFSLRIPNPVSGYFLQARILENNNWNSYIRTREFNNGEDKENLIIRSVPYDNLAENQITPEQFKAHMSEIQPIGYIRKWDLVGETSNPFQGIEIVDFSPVTGGSFTLEKQNFIRDTMLANMSCYTGGMLTAQNTHVQIDNGTLPVHYTYDPNLNIIPNSGWMVVVPVNLIGFGGTAAPTFYARQLIGEKIRLNDKSDSPGIISHEQGHGFIVPRGHSLSIPPKKTIMNENIVIVKPSEIDCKAGKLIYEPNYTVIDTEFPRYLGEHQKEILDLEFGLFD